MIVDRLFTPGLAQVAYFVADETSGEVAVIDPRRDVEVYLDWAEQRGFRITAILETHVHADFVSGVLELEARTGAPIHTSRLGDQDFPHVALDDGDEIRVGSLRLRAMFTPGHTPEHMAYLVFEDDAETPAALFSGDALFVGDVGRPDLLGEEQTAALSRQLYETVFHRLSPLPDDLIVYPGHTAGSACGKKIGDAPHTTIGAEKMWNYAFQESGQDAFVASVMEDMPSPPTYYPVLKRVNKKGAPLVESLSSPQAMDTAELTAARDAGALVVDVRDKAAFGEGHIPGAVFAGFGPNFHAWMGWLAPYDRDIIVVADDGAQLEEIVTAFRQIGLDRVIGYLNGGMAAWTGEQDTLPQISAGELAGVAGENLAVLDVRSRGEWLDSHIADAEHLFLGEVLQGATLPDTLRKDQAVALICGSGYRSTVAASVLKAQGYRNLVNVDGGMAAWQEASRAGRSRG